MHILDLTLPSPEQNLACDEALLDACEGGDAHEVLRFWEPRQHFVVLGYSSRISSEAKLAACRQARVPILRRISGGGTVLQGPGCLNATLVLRLERHASLQTISGTTAFILERHRQALEPAVGRPVERRGLSDLALEGMKFSGNAQRRKRGCVLFHGTFLLDMDLSLVDRLLALPSRQPDYRRNRAHQAFLMNLRLPAETVKRAVAEAWGATEPLAAVPMRRIAQLATERYSSEEWIRRL